METAIAFGSGKNLIGTISIPSIRSNAIENIGFVFFNAGVVHRVGPHRINVRVARALAAMGIPSLRFDLSGLGDSGRAASNAASSHAEQAVADIKSALDTLAAAAGVDRFVVCSVCSGTVHSYDAAIADHRVAGLVLLDSYMYPTLRAKARYLVMRVKRRLKEGTAISWLMRRFIGNKDASDQARGYVSSAEREAGPGFFAFRPDKKDFAAMLNSLASRDVRISLVYAGSSFEHYNYAGQFADAFAGHSLSPYITAAFLPNIDHTATRVAAQVDLLKFVEGWVSENFSIGNLAGRSRHEK
jgi:pimeloyl-ACP methyl ester carboxylesterase